MCSATFIPAGNSALLYLHALTAKWTTAIVSEFIAFLKADEKIAGYIPTYVHRLQTLFFQTFLALA